MIKGDKISLRKIRESDLKAMYELTKKFSDIGEQDYPFFFWTEHEAKEKYHKGEFWNDNNSTMLILDGEENIVGEISFFKGSFYMSGYELGYRLYKKEYMRKGYMTEALKLFSKFLFTSRQIERLEVRTLTQNIASKRVAEKCGFKHEGTLRNIFFQNDKYCDANVLSILREDFKTLTEKENNTLMYEFNNTYAEYPMEKTIVQLFEEQVERKPNNIALIFKDMEMTYLELNEKANQLARLLKEKGVGPEKLVGIMAERSFEMIIGIIAILKSGGAYLPIDPEYPNDRIKYMLEDSNSQYLLIHDELIDRCKELEYEKEKIVNMNNPIINEKEISNLDKIGKSDNLMYIIYTSGSTGKPKGVMVEHKSVVNLCFWHNSNFAVTEKDRSTKCAGFSFDASVWEIFPYLIVGAGIYILDKDCILDLKLYSNKIKEKNITIGFLPTQICEKITKDIALPLRILLTGGEKLKKYTDIGCILVNNYGPTETTVLSTSCIVENTKNIPIGKPIANTRIYIVDKNNEMVPIGLSGELCISGDGVARGYYNQPELTEEKFIENPYEPGNKMYKTGDLARWLPDGSIEYVDRIDYQVKIRGFRIELGEIEAKLALHPDIKESVVTAKENGALEKYLCAYFVSKENISVMELREYLLKELPEYMIPLYFIRVEKMPLTPNGKIDRKALPEPDGKIMTASQYEAPKNEIEEELVQMWQSVLGIKKIGINDNFFELGGDSMKAITILTKANQMKLNISLDDILKKATISKIAKNIRLKEKNEICSETKNRKEITLTKYPYYYSCLYGVLLEKLKLEKAIDIESSFLPLMGGTTFMGYVSFNEYPDKIQHIEFPFSELAGHKTLEESLGLKIGFKSFDKLEDGVNYCKEKLNSGNVVAVTGTTYYLNYTHDYLVGEEEWTKRLDRGEQTNVRMDPNAKGFAHAFLLLDITDDSYVIYDINFNYYGEIPAGDFHRAFTGLRGMKFLDGHPAQETNMAHQIVEIDAENMKKFTNKQLGFAALKQNIQGFMVSKKIELDVYLPGKIKTTVTATVGLEAMNEIIITLEKIGEVSDYQSRFVNLKDFYEGVFNQWMEKYMLIRDFLKAFSHYQKIEESIIDGFEKAVEDYSAILKESRELNLLKIEYFTKSIMIKLRIMHKEHSKLFSKLEEVAQLDGENFC